MVYVQRVKLRESIRMYVAVGIGGVLGSVARFLISIVIPTDHFGAFPWATWTVNVSGAFLLTFLLFLPAVRHHIPPLVFMALTTGLLGSYTTFSTMTVESVMLFQENIRIGIVYVCLTLFGGLSASYGGYQTALHLRKRGCRP